MPDTRIILRHDTTANWESSGATDLARGEIGIRIDESVSGDETAYFADLLLGVTDGGAPISEAIYVGGGGIVIKSGVAEPEIVGTTPVVYEDDAFKPDGTTVRWDATNSKWVADAKVLTLDAYPTVDGTVVYDADAGKFVVGTAVAATEIDGGTYP
jgi:hypothetical protein